MMFEGPLAPHPPPLVYIFLGLGEVLVYYCLLRVIVLC